MENCFKLQRLKQAQQQNGPNGPNQSRFSPSWGNGRQSVANTASGPESESKLAQQVEALIQLLSQQNQAGSGGPQNIHTEEQNIQATMASMEGTQSNGNRCSWIIDSGASDHMTNNRSILTDFNFFSIPKSVRIANGLDLKVLGKGNVKLTAKLILRDVFYVPCLSFNLVSISKITHDNHCLAVFSSSHCFFQETRMLKMIGSARQCKGLYIIQSEERLPVVEDLLSPRISACYNSRTVLPSNSLERILLWHKRLGYPNFVYLKKVMPQLFSGIHVTDLKCEVCIFAKQTRGQYLPRPYESSSPFNLIHSDVWGPSRVANLNGSRWFVTFVDDHSRLTWVYLMKNKSEVGDIVKQYITLIRTQFNTTIKVLRSDNGTEYVNHELKDYLGNLGIHHQTSCVYTPQQNGVAERKNRHLLDVARAIMFATNTPKIYWGEAILTATYLINRMPSRVLSFKIQKRYCWSPILPPS